MIIAGTGHRPKYCPCKYKNSHPWLDNLKADLKQKLEYYQEENKIEAVICGAAIGFDTWLAQCVTEMCIPLWTYVPFKGQGSNWPSESKREYERLLKLSEKVLYISDKYSKECFLKRDRAMINDAHIIFSLLNPEVQEGGTYYTVSYAKSLGKTIHNFWS